MPQRPITGDAGSPRRPRDMDARRRAAWDAAFEKLDAGLEVTPEAHAALLRPGLFEGLSPVAAPEEAACVVRYWLHGFDWSPIPPRGPTIAAQWPRIESAFSPQHADEALRNYIQASRHDPTIGRRSIASRRGITISTGCFPHRWTRGRASVTGESGRPRRSHAVTTGAPPMRRRIGTSRWPRCFTLLGYLGLQDKKKGMRRSVISEAFACSEDAVRKAVETHARQTGTPSPPLGMLAGAQAPRPRPTAPQRRSRPGQPTTAPPAP